MRNPFEQWAWESLKKITKGSATISYETETLPYVLPVKPHKYKPDFIVRFNDNRNRTIYIETKGYFRPADRTKFLAVRNSNPGIDLRLVFQKDKPISKKSKTMYSVWCKKHGIIYSIGIIPNDWFK